MAKIKVSQLMAALKVNNEDLIMIVQDGVSKKASGDMFLRPETAVAVLALRGAAFLDVGTLAGMVAAGNHGHANDANIGGPFTPAGVDNAPVGILGLFMRTTAPARYIAANGALLSRAAYPALWAEAQASGNLVSEAAWYAGQYGSYSVGDGSTTFRLPDLRGYGIRVWDNGRWIDYDLFGWTYRTRVLGSAQSDAMQNITGTFGMDDQTASQLSGAFYNAGAFNYDADSQGGGGYVAGFDASRQVRTAYETRMKNIAMLACIKYI